MPTILQPGQIIQGKSYQGGEDIVVKGGVLKNSAFVGNKGNSQISVKVPKGETARIEHFYLGDGDGRTRGYAGKAPIFVQSSHGGTVIINEINVQGMSDNGIYASSCGNPPAKNGGGAKGQVIITNSFGRNCESCIFRIGSPDSYCENCVVGDADGQGTPRAFWSYYHKNRFTNCKANAGNFMQVSSSAWGSQQGATAVLENCTKTSSTRGPDVKKGGKVVGQVATGNPNLVPPKGVPLTAEEAVNGTSSADGESVPAPQSGTGGAGGIPGQRTGDVVASGPTTYQGGNTQVPPMPTGSDSYKEIEVDPKDHQILRNVLVGSDSPGSVKGLKKGDLVMVDFVGNERRYPFVSDFIYSVQEEAPAAGQTDWRQRVDQAIVDSVQQTKETTTE